MLYRRVLAAVSLGLAAATSMPARAAPGGELGDVIPVVELKALDGKKVAIASRKASANVIFFFRTDQEHSADALKAMAECEKEFAAKPVNWVAVVSDSEPVDAVKQVVAESGVRMPVLVDVGDVLYGRLEVRLHPYTVILDKQSRVTVREPFHEIGYCDRIRAQIRFVLKEITAEEVAKLENPEKATFRIPGGVAKRHLNYGRLLLEQKKWEKALEQAEKALVEGPLAAAWTLRGHALAGLGRCAEAIDAFDMALKLDPAEAAAKEGRKGCGK